MTVLCGACNAENRAAAKFCKGCGRKIAQAWAQATPAAAGAGAGEATVLLSAAAAAVPAPRAPALAAAVADPVFLAPSPLRPRIGNGRWIASLGLAVVLLVAASAWWGHRNRSIPIAQPPPLAAGDANSAPAAVEPPVVAPAVPAVLVAEKLILEPGEAAPAAPKPRKVPAKKQPAPTPAPVPQVAAPAPPPPAPEPLRVATPQESCAGRNFIAHAQCMAAQCARPDVASHAQCEAVRRQQRLEEEKRNPIAN